MGKTSALIKASLRLNRYLRHEQLITQRTLKIKYKATITKIESIQLTF